MARLLSQRSLDKWLPTLVRYVGVALACGLGVKAVFFGGLDYPSLGILAAGMILFKNVAGGFRDQNYDERNDRDNRDQK